MKQTKKYYFKLPEQIVWLVGLFSDNAVSVPMCSWCLFCVCVCGVRDVSNLYAYLDHCGQTMEQIKKFYFNLPEQIV